MREKIENARRQSMEAQLKAVRCAEQTARDEWMAVARMWDDIATEYERLDRLGFTAANGHDG